MESLRLAKLESSPRQQQQLRRATWLVTLLTASAAMTLIAVMQFSTYRSTLANAQRRVNSAAMSIVHITDLQIDSTEGPLQALEEALQADPAVDLEKLLVRVQSRHPELYRLVALDGAGRVLARSRTDGNDDWSATIANAPIDIGGMILRVGIAPVGDADAGAPLRVAAATGAARAIWFGAEIAPATLEANLRNSPFGAAGTYAVRFNNGALIARLGEVAVRAGAVDSDIHGSMASTRYPYTVIATMARRDAMAIWSSQAWTVVGGMLLLLALIAVAAHRVLSAQKRQATLVGFLFRQAEQLDTVQRIGRVGLWELDLISGRLAWSGEAQPIIGQPDAVPSDIARYLACVHPHDREDVSSWFWRCMHEEGPFEGEHRIVRADGDTAYVHLRAVRQIGRVKISGTLREVTALYTAQQKLRETEAQYRFLFDHSPLAGWVFDVQSHAILAVNDMAVATYGYSREEFLRMRIEDLRPPSEIPHLRQALANGEALGRTDRIWLHCDRNGKLLHVRCDGSAIEFAGRPARLVIAFDHTDKIHAERELDASHARFQMLARATNDAVWDMDLLTGAQWWSDAFYHLYGYDRHEDNGLQVWASRVHEEDRPRITASIDAFMAGNALTWQEAYRLRRKNGSYAHVFARAYVIRDDAGQAIRSVGSVIDQTAMVETRQALQESEQSHRSLLAHLPLPLLLVRDGVIAYANLLAEDRLSTGGTPLTGQAVAQHFEAKVVRALTDPKAAGTRIHAQVRPLGQADFVAELSLSAYQDSIGVGMQIIMRDITDQRRHEQQLNFQATHDELTGLPNRRALHETLAHMIAQARSAKRQLMLLFIDLDHFKVINDALGHLVGDEVLRKVSLSLCQAVGPDSYVARFGGDEFVAVVPCRNIDSDAPAILPALKAAIERPLLVAGMQQHLNCSIGVAYLGIDGEDAETLVRNADSAMYEAKRAGRHTWRRYSSQLHDVALSRLAVVSRLTEQALDDELELHYQSQHRGADATAYAVEALLRWPSGPGELSQPNLLVPLLEETGTIVIVGRWVLRQACRDQREISRIMGTPITVAVNISAYQLIHDDLVGLVRNALDDSGVEARYLELELTESAFMSEPERAIETLRQLKAMGVSIALDDFGTGYSNLNYLSRMPIDKLKIDRSFVSRLSLDATDRALCESILFLARSLSMTVIAEGVETAAQRDWLIAHGCQAMQGFLFGRPVPIEQLSRATSPA